MAPSRLLTRFASRMAQALGMAPKTLPWIAEDRGGLIVERRHHADCLVVPMGCVPGCETDDELRGRIQRIVRELDE